MAFMDFYDVVVDAAQRNVLISMDYSSPRDGKFTSGRLVEPYSLRDIFFFGFDVEANHIKKFYQDGITNIVATEIPFFPRFPIEF